MKKKDLSKLTENFKMSKKSSVIPSAARDLYKATRILIKDGVIIFPTDTVYGLGCRFDSQIAAARIHRIKGSTQAFPILVGDMREAHRLAKFSTAAANLAGRFWPGALTLILPAKSGGTIGLRIANSDLINSLIKKSGFPIIATSANFHGQKTPTTFAQISKNLVKKVDFALVGQCKYKKESTVVDATVSPPRVLRKGAIAL